MRARRGGYSIEFALLMPVFVSLVFGVVEYTWVMYHSNALSQASALGCRAGSLLDPGQNEAELASVLEATEEEMLFAMETRGPGCATACVAVAEAVGERPSRSLQCRIAMEYTGLTGIVPTPGSLAGQTVVRFEYQRSE